MNNAIRHTWVFSVGLFLVLFAALSVVQVGVTDQLEAHPQNVRELYQDRGASRGAITVDGTAIADSVPSPDTPFDHQRVYRDSEVYSGLTGFYSIVEQPNGLEGAMNEYLSGRSDSQFFDRITSLFTGDTTEGAQVELTVDPELQRLAHDTIADGTQGSIVVTDVETGEVKAMASKPSFDANALATHSSSEFVATKEELQDQNVPLYGDPAIKDRFFPGSTFKLLDTAAMLESGDYAADEELEVPDELELPNSDTPITNFRGGICSQREEAELSWIFAQSCNTPFAAAAMDLGEDEIRSTAEAFGFNDSELQIPMSVTESVFPEDLTQASLAQSSIGGFEVQATPLQMNMVAAAIANDGTMMAPHLVESVRGPDLQVLEQSEPKELGEPISSSTAEELSELMKGPIESGTAVGAQSDVVDIHAKTGTADFGETTESGAPIVNSWITGFADVGDSTYAVTVAYQDIPYEDGHNLTVSNLKTMFEGAVDQ